MCACLLRHLPSNQMAMGSIPLEGFYYFFNFYQTLRVCHALVQSCAIYRLCTVLSLGLNYPQMLSKPLRCYEITQFFYALKLPILYIKFGEKMVFFHSILEKLFLISSRILKRLSWPLQDEKTQKLSLNFRGPQPHCATAPVKHFDMIKKF